jgi:hypothetical protein
LLELRSIEKPGSMPGFFVLSWFIAVLQLISSEVRTPKWLFSQGKATFPTGFELSTGIGEPLY